MTKTRILALLALASLALTGCASATDSSPISNVGTYPDSPVKGGSNDLGSAAGISSRTDSAVITTASAFLTGDDPAQVGTDVSALATKAGGKIDGRSVQSDPDGTTTFVSLTIRVPAAELDSFLAGMDSIATVHSLNQNSTDVTLIVTDYNARISALKSSIARFIVLEQSAKNTQDLISIESALAERQAQLEQLESEMRYYSDQIALSTVQVDIGLPESATDPIPDDFWGGIVAGWNGLVAFLGGTLVAFGVAIPWLPFVAGIAWLGWWVGRRLIARQTAKPVQKKTAAKR
jgi:hypothetical protein